MQNMNQGSFYRALITEWDGSKESVHVQRTGDDVAIYYHDGVHQHEYSNQYGELVTERADKFVVHHVTLSYFRDVLNPYIAGYGAPEYNREVHITGPYN